MTAKGNVQEAPPFVQDDKGRPPCFDRARNVKSCQAHPLPRHMHFSTRVDRVSSAQSKTGRVVLFVGVCGCAELVDVCCPNAFHGCCRATDVALARTQCLNLSLISPCVAQRPRLVARPPPGKGRGGGVEGGTLDATALGFDLVVEVEPFDDLGAAAAQNLRQCFARAANCRGQPLPSTVAALLDGGLLAHLELV